MNIQKSFNLHGTVMKTTFRPSSNNSLANKLAQFILSSDSIIEYGTIRMFKERGTVYVGVIGTNVCIDFAYKIGIKHSSISKNKKAMRALKSISQNTEMGLVIIRKISQWDSIIILELEVPEFDRVRILLRRDTIMDTYSEDGENKIDTEYLFDIEFNLQLIDDFIKILL